MSRRRKILTIAGAIVAGLIPLLLIAAVMFLESAPFRLWVRNKIISAAEESTGGRVELSSFGFDLWRLRATLTGFVLHGTEPAGAPPLLQAQSVEVDLSIFAGLGKAIDLRSLIVERPRVNVIVNPDGSTNVPEPRVKRKSEKAVLETVVDLAIGHFELRDGAALFGDRGMALDFRGDNLRAQLDFSRLKRNYQGQVSMAPLRLRYGRNQSLDLRLNVPVTIDGSHIAFDNAKIATTQSEVTLSGAFENLASPVVDVHAAARVALRELDPSLASGTLMADLHLKMSDERIQVSSSHFALGRSTVDAVGVLKDTGGNPSGVQLRGRLDLGELGQRFNIGFKPDGFMSVLATAKLTGHANYTLAGTVGGRDLSVLAGGRRLSNIGLASAISADAKRVALRDLRVDALGGEFAGSATVEDLARLQVAGGLRDIDLDTLVRAFLDKAPGYGGTLAGPVQVEVDLKAAGATGTRASARLGIAPGGRGVPISGAVNARYNGATDTVEIADSHLSFPHSRLDLSGKLDERINLVLHSTDLNDFLPAVQAISAEPVKQMPAALNHGTATFSGAMSGTFSTPQLRGHLTAEHISVEGREFDKIAADVSLSPSAAAVENARIANHGMQIDASANVGLRDWKALPDGALILNLTVRNGNAKDLVALAGQPEIPVTGAVNADVHLGGTLGNPTGSAQVAVTNGVAYDQEFSQAQGHAEFANQRVTLSGGGISTPAGNVQLSGAFDHPAQSFNTGRIQAQFSTTQLLLGQLNAVDERVHGLAGTMQASAQLSASLNKVKDRTQFLISAVTADVNVRGLAAGGETFGDVTGTARTDGSTVSYQLTSDLARSTIRVKGRTELQTDYPTSADASVESLPLERLLALAGSKDFPVRGILSGKGQVSGTMANPTAAFDLALTNATVYGEQLDRVALRATYTGQLIDVQRFEIVDGPGRIEGSIQYARAARDQDAGRAKFHLASTGVSLAQSETLRRHYPGLDGTVDLAANGALDVRERAKGSWEVLLTALDGTLGASGVVVNKLKLGGLKLAAQTTGDRVTFNVNSDLGGSKIEGHGTTTLSADYPTTAEVRFSNLTYTGLRPLIAPQLNSAPQFEVVADAEATLDGPLMKTESIRAKASVSRLELTSAIKPSSSVRNVAVHNDGPIVVSLDRSALKVQHAHIVGPQTDIVVAGTAGIQAGSALDFSLNATTNLGLLQQMTRDIFSSGAVALQATVRGTVAKPIVNGRIELKDASLNYIDFPNGISKANGTIVFNARNATIQSLTAETGGGKISATGFVSYGTAVPSYSLKATARDVRVRYPPGASIMARARLELAGTAERSVLGGTVLLEKIGFSPQSDFGSMLSRSTEPTQAPSSPVGPLAGMRLDVSIRTAGDVVFETSLAQNIQATADLSLRGTAESPGMLGRVTITQGEVVFFGSKYTVNQGNVNFYDPTRIRPVLNVDLETVAKGVTVDLNVTGPIDNMKLTHRSDPPLQFNEIVALLATGRTPSSDPNLVAQQSAAPPQSMQQMGESAVVSQAIANPMSSRLQRVFGVSQLKIDPTFTSGSELPQARVTLQQQITSNLTFSYISNLNQTNSEIIRVEWALNPQWLVVVQREETGRFGVDFFYKKSFR